LGWKGERRGVLTVVDIDEVAVPSRRLEPAGAGLGSGAAGRRGDRLADGIVVEGPAGEPQASTRAAEADAMVLVGRLMAVLLIMGKTPVRC
jgi:hypothetical protein